MPNDNHDERGRFAAGSSGGHSALVPRLTAAMGAFARDTGHAQHDHHKMVPVMSRALHMAEKAGLTEPATAGEIPGLRIVGHLVGYLTSMALMIAGASLFR